MKRLTVIAGLVVMLVLTGSAYASIAYYEGFNYTPNTSLLDNGYFNGPWYGNGDSCLVQAGSVVYPGLVTTGNKAYIAPGSTRVSVLGVLPSAVTSLFTSPGTFYVTFLIYGGSAEVTLGAVDDPSYPTAIQNAVDVFQWYDPINISQYWLRRLIVGTSDNGWVSTGSAAIPTRLHAFRIQNEGTPGNDVIQEVLDPVMSAGEPDWDSQSVVTYTTADLTKAVDGIFLSGNLSRGAQDTYIDEIRIATTWAEAAPYQAPQLPPTAPSGLTATPTTIQTWVDLSWTDNSSDEEGFKVERGPSNTGPWTLIATLAANAQTYEDTNSSAETTHYYRVGAFNPAGTNYSGVDDATTGVALVPETLSYQGKLTNPAGAPAADGTYTMIFKVYDAELAGNLIWTSTDTPVTTSGGLFSAKIRRVPNSAFPTKTHVWMEISVNGETLTPRIEVTADPYALRAGYVGP